MISLDHLFQSWDQFKRGKRKRKDLQFFERHLEDQIFQLHADLLTRQYKPDLYEHFYVTDPKQRRISKATVRDRLVHQMLYNRLVEIYDKKFIFHSLSSRKDKGIHAGITHLRRMIQKVGQSGKRCCFALKMDIRRFFDTVDHDILKSLIRKNIQDEHVLNLVDGIIDSFHVNEPRKGIPLGNVTSQLFANIYLHVLDDFIKQKLKLKYYQRYCDDFIILSHDEQFLHSLIFPIQSFLAEQLQLELHPKKLILRKLQHGIDFIGYVFFEKYSLLRTRTKHRMKKRLEQAYIKYLKGELDETSMDQRLQSYLGILSHADQYDLSQALKNAYWVRK